MPCLASSRIITHNPCKISIDLLSKFNIEFIKVSAGNQAADMFIAFYIGQILCDLKETDEIVIISRDTDFDSLINTLKSQIKISRVFSGEKPKVSAAIEHNNLVIHNLKKSGLKDTDVGKIAKQVASFLRNGEKVKLSTYRYLIKMYGMKKGVELYNYIKKYYKSHRRCSLFSASCGVFLM